MHLFIQKRLIQVQFQQREVCLTGATLRLKTQAQISLLPITQRKVRGNGVPQGKIKQGRGGWEEGMHADALEDLTKEVPFVQDLRRKAIQVPGKDPFRQGTRQVQGP